MKKYTVKKGKHDFSPWQFKIYWKKRNYIKYNIRFDSTCRYDLGDEDQEDMNKLFGLGYFSGFKSITHTDSARFGWNYNKEKDVIQIFSYCYVNSQRLYNYSKPICYCNIDEDYEFCLGISMSNYHFIVWDKDDVLSKGSESIPYNHSKKLSFLLTPWFGGNESAPNDMSIYMEKE